MGHSPSFHAAHGCYVVGRSLLKDRLRMGRTRDSMSVIRLRAKSYLFAQPLDRVPEKLSQHRHKKDGAVNVAVVNLLIPLFDDG